MTNNKYDVMSYDRDVIEEQEDKNNIVVCCMYNSKSNISVIWSSGNGFVTKFKFQHATQLLRIEKH